MYGTSSAGGSDVQSLCCMQRAPKSKYPKSLCHLLLVVAARYKNNLGAHHSCCEHSLCDPVILRMRLAIILIILSVSLAIML